MVKVKKDLTGKEFGRLTVICRADDQPNGRGGFRAMWRCKCGCDKGTITIVRGAHLTSGTIQSCGCLKMERAFETNKKYNSYEKRQDEHGEWYYVGWTSNTNKEFYFNIEDYNDVKDLCWSEKISRNYHRLQAYSVKLKRMVTMSHVLGCKNYDHIDRNPLNNRRNNLRPATLAENARNKTKLRDNESGVMGVGWNKKTQKWIVRIMVDRQSIYLGLFVNKEDAIKARLNAEVKYFGEFAPQKHLYEQYGITEN